jgi:FKBP-type peptidyl-prolyl cis-trans isomerase
MSEAEAKQVREAFVAQLKSKAEVEYNQVASKNKTEGDAFIAKNKSKPGVKVTASGLQYEVVQAGTGQRPGPNDTVTINYTGTFVNGEKFDSSADHQGPAQIPLAAVIPGFREGLQLMQTGGKYKLYIPSNIAYGAKPENGFPPNATIIFDVELLKTGPTAAGAAGPQGAPGGAPKGN